MESPPSFICPIHQIPHFGLCCDKCDLGYRLSRGECVQGCPEGFEETAFTCSGPTSRFQECPPGHTTIGIHDDQLLCARNRYIAKCESPPSHLGLEGPEEYPPQSTHPTIVMESTKSSGSSALTIGFIVLIIGALIPLVLLIIWKMMADRPKQIQVKKEVPKL